MKRQKTISVLAAWSCLVCQSFAQKQPFVVEKPKAPVVVRPYKGAVVPPVQLKNSERLHDLIRAGKLYLTIQDALALAIENNLDLEVDRYGPLIAHWQEQRSRAGGPLRGVTSGNTLINQATGGQGIAGSQASAGLSSGGGGNNGGSGGAIISQIGPVTANLDPVFQNATAFSHTTSPQANTIQSQTEALVDTRHVFNSFVQQGLLSGGYVQVTANESYLKENTPTDILNPSVAPVVQISVRHQLLQGFGTGVNSRFIRVAEKNVTASHETFRSQLLNIVSNVSNLYWDLVTDIADLSVREHARDAAQKFYEDTKKEIELGYIAKVDIYRAEAEFSTRRQELAISLATVRQQEILLKNALSRNGLEDPLLDAAEVVPLDRIEVPEKDDLPPLRELVATAMAKRPDVAFSLISDETQKISALGTQNGVLPSLQVITSTTSNGLSGKSNPQPGGFAADPKFVGGIGNALAQVFGLNYPSRRAGVLFQGSIGNHIAQGDYGIDQLQLRQGDLIEQRTMNQLVVDVSNQMVALRQARARYSAAVNTRTLQEQLLEKEQQKFSLGSSTINDLIAAQRTLTSAQTAEVGSLAIYSRARVGLDQVLGETLEKNHISTDDALKGTVAHQSRLPEAVVAAKPAQ